jgi:hypothetical protein
MSPAPIDCPLGPMTSHKPPSFRDAEPDTSPVTVREALIFGLVEDLEASVARLTRELAAVTKERDAYRDALRSRR